MKDTCTPVVSVEDESTCTKILSQTKHNVNRREKRAKARDNSLQTSLYEYKLEPEDSDTQAIQRIVSSTSDSAST